MSNQPSEFGGYGNPRDHEDEYAKERREMFRDVDEGVEAPVDARGSINGQ